MDCRCNLVLAWLVTPGGAWLLERAFVCLSYSAHCGCGATDVGVIARTTSRSMRARRVLLWLATVPALRGMTAAAFGADGLCGMATGATCARNMVHGVAEHRCT